MPTFKEALRYWLRLGCISFGGPAGQIAVMHKELVENRRWFSDAHFLHAMNFCMMLPGPEAQQLAIYLGWRLHGAKGGIAAGVLFVLPAALLLFFLSWLYMAGGHISGLSAAFHGLLGAVIAVVCEASLRIGAKALRTPALRCVAAASFVAIYGLDIAFPVLIGAAALLGLLSPPRHFPPPKDQGGRNGAGGIELPPLRPATGKRSLMVCAVCFALWWLPVFAIAHQLGWHSTHAEQGFFFSKAALVTFGGAYAVLPYVAQQAVAIHGWLTANQMMSGLALAETTPGPLIMVLQFVGFVGGWNHPGTLSPFGSATLGAAITSWVTFLPSFLFVFLGAPHVEKLAEHRRLGAMLTSMTAAVVGVILNLGIHFSKDALWPNHGPFDTLVAVTAIGAFVAMRWLKVGLVPVIGSSALLGVAKHLLSS
jgi:chromate transporter